MNEPTVREVVEQTKIDHERGFYLEFGNGRLRAGRDDAHKPPEGVKVIGVLDE